jgi:hypothetical protein
MTRSSENQHMSIFWHHPAPILSQPNGARMANLAQRFLVVCSALCMDTIDVSDNVRGLNLLRDDFLAANVAGVS